VQPQIVASIAEEDSSNNKENLKEMVPQLGRGYAPGSLIDL